MPRKTRIPVAVRTEAVEDEWLRTVINAGGDVWMFYAMPQPDGTRLEKSVRLSPDMEARFLALVDGVADELVADTHEYLRNPVPRAERGRKP